MQHTRVCAYIIPILHRTYIKTHISCSVFRSYLARIGILIKRLFKLRQSETFLKEA